MPAIDQFTLTAIPLQQYFNETYLGQATGFLWQTRERHYLVTNWHVLSRRGLFLHFKIFETMLGALILCVRFSKYPESFKNRNGASPFETTMTRHSGWSIPVVELISRYCHFRPAETPSLVCTP